jgi:hypothetical protein
MTDVQNTSASTSSWIAALAAGWIVPGAGHFLLGRQGRGVLIFISVTTMFVLGLMMRGPMFQPQGGDLLTTIIYYGGFLAHIASGALYFIAIALGYNQPDVAGHVYDYGSKFLVGAGLLNVLALVDIYELGTGKKS